MAEVVVSLPDDLLAEVDAQAQLRASDRSTVVTLMLRHGMHRDTATMDAAMARLRERFKGERSTDFIALIRAERDRDERDDS